MAILKQVALENLFAIGMFILTAYILWVSLKTGLVFGKWPGQVCDKRNRPVLYWLGVSAYAFCFGCSIYILILIIKADIVAANWPAPAN